MMATLHRRTWFASFACDLRWGHIMSYPFSWTMLDDVVLLHVINSADPQSKKTQRPGREDQGTQREDGTDG